MEPGRSEPDDEAWRSIVDNYGDRAELDDAGPQPPAPAPVPTPDAAGDRPDTAADPDRFVPPVPPPVPRPTRDRQAAWAGVLGVPVLVLVLLLLGIPLGGLALAACVVAFIGGFGYLVLQLPRTPEDPWDDGARL